MIIIKEFEDKDFKEWNEFVNEHNDSTIYHLYEWRKIYKSSYNLKSYYLGFYKSNRLIGVLPSIVIQRPCSKPFLVSLPFSNYAGLLLENNSDEKNIIEQIQKLILNYKISGFENRKLLSSFTNVSSEVTLKKKLPRDSNTLWLELDAKVRNQIRKAERSGLTYKWGDNQRNELYDIYAKNMLLLGTPVHSKKFIDSIILELKDSVNILTIRLEEIPIAAMMLFKFKSQLSDPIASSLKKYLAYNPNMLLYWEALKYGCENGFNEFDFGRSSLNSGTYKFKLQWDAQPFSLIYNCYSPNNTKTQSTINLYRGNKAKIFSNIWKRFPLYISLWIGPKLRKYLP